MGRTPAWKAVPMAPLTFGLRGRCHCDAVESLRFLPVDQFTLMTFGIHFYDSVVVMEKRRMDPPKQFMTRAMSVSLSENQPRFKP
jgi:hypothetical protein